jgi:hypothetical protein
MAQPTKKKQRESKACQSGLRSQAPKIGMKSPTANAHLLVLFSFTRQKYQLAGWLSCGKVVRECGSFRTDRNLCGKILIGNRKEKARRTT